MIKCSRYVFIICLIAAIGLIIGGFLIPPMGVIDGSVLTAVGEIFGFAALGTLPSMINDHTATIQHGNTTLTIGKDEEENPNNN